ncbi:MAG: RNA polymerase sigma-70 factor [Chitinophagaceae bacterium]|nr:RNA polymerase sigma-70 factor [Chitinophagaceae bacterium]
MLHAEFTSEQELFRQVSEGNKNAFRVLFDLYHGRLTTFIFRLTKSETTAAELVQDIFVKLWVNRAELPDVKNVQAYLFTMASNRTIDHLRKISAESRMLARLWTRISRYQESTEDVYNAKEYNELINQAVIQLSPQKQKIFRLSRYEGLNHEEIATQLGLSKSTVKNHLVDALRHIKSYVNVLKH